MSAASPAYPAGERLGKDGCRLLMDVSAEDDASNVLTTQYFSPVPGVVEVPGAGQAFLDAIARLRYGAIAIIDDVQSGIGTVHNALLIDRPERTIVRGPFRPFQRSSLRHSEPDHPVILTFYHRSSTARR